MSRIHQPYAGIHCILDFYMPSIISLSVITLNPDMNRTILIILSIVVFIVSFQADPFLHEFHGGGLAPAAQFFSILGNGITLLVICVLFFTAGLIFKNESIRKSGIYGSVAVLAAGILVQILKTVFERPRPNFSDTGLLMLLENPTLFDFSGKFNSFPSGHTTVSFSLAYILSKSHPRFSLVFYALAGAVGLSRVYLGSHYPSDVIGGAIVGTGISLFLFSDIRKDWKTTIFLTGAVFVSFFKLGGLLLFDVDEAVFSEATREMVETGNYITPTYNYEPRYDKPILFYWLQAIAYKLFGASEFSARLPSAVSGVGLSAITFFFIKRLYDQRVALLAGLCLILNLQFFVYTHSAVTDMTLTLFITASLYSFYLGFHHYHTSHIAHHNKWYMLYWVFAALAALTKGIIGILFPAAIVFIYLLTAGRLSDIKTLLAPRYILVFLAVAAPWYIAQFYINGWEFFNAFIIKHHFKRYTDVISSHSGPIYFYVPVILAGFFPWVAFLPNAFYRGIKEKGLYLFALIWFSVVFVFFSISGTKLPNYIMPLFPAMAIMAGLTINNFIEGRLKKAWLYASVISLVTIAIAIAMTSFALPYYQVAIEINLPHYLFWGIGICFIVIALFSLTILTGKQYPLSIGGIALAVTVLLIILRTYAVPPVNLQLQKTLYQYSSYAWKNLGDDGLLATYEINQPSISFYSRKRILKLDGEKGINELQGIMISKDILLITKKEYIQKLMDGLKLKLIDTDGKYAMLGNR